MFWILQDPSAIPEPLRASEGLLLPCLQTSAPGSWPQLSQESPLAGCAWECVLLSHSHVVARQAGRPLLRRPVSHEMLVDTSQHSAGSGRPPARQLIYRGQGLGARHSQLSVPLQDHVFPYFLHLKRSAGKHSVFGRENGDLPPDEQLGAGRFTKFPCRRWSYEEAVPRMCAVPEFQNPAHLPPVTYSKFKCGELHFHGGQCLPPECGPERTHRHKPVTHLALNTPAATFHPAPWAAAVPQARA